MPFQKFSLEKFSVWFVSSLRGKPWIGMKGRPKERFLEFPFLYWFLGGSCPKWPPVDGFTQHRGVLSQCQRPENESQVWEGGAQHFKESFLLLWFLVAPGGCWWFLVAPGGYWWVLVTPGVQLAVVIDSASA